MAEAVELPESAGLGIPARLDIQQPRRELAQIGRETGLSMTALAVGWVPAVGHLRMKNTPAATDSSDGQPFSQSADCAGRDTSKGALLWRPGLKPADARSADPADGR